MENVIADTDSTSLSRCGYSVRGLSNWILDLGDRLGHPITNMALNKLVYFAYEKVLLEEKAIITDAKIEAWEHGPVFREVYHAFKNAGDRPIKERASFYSVDTGQVETSSVSLEPRLQSVLEEFLAPLLRLGASRLRDISHADGGPWHHVWSYEGHANPGMEITPQLILSTANKQGTFNGRH
jgi:uncharacterized phage-associated protein